MQRIALALALVFAMTGVAAASDGAFTVLFSLTPAGHHSPHVLLDIPAGNLVVPARFYLGSRIEDGAGPTLVSTRTGSALYEIGLAKPVGPVAMGIGLRSGGTEIVETHRQPVTYYVDSSGNLVPPDVATDPTTGDVLPGYQEVQGWHYWHERRGAPITEPSLMLSLPVDLGPVAAGLHASYGASGLAWLATAGVRVGAVVVTVGYQDWPAEDWHSGVVAGLSLTF